MIQPGLCSVTFRQQTPEEVVALAAEARLAAIEWGSDVHVPADQLANAAQVRMLTEAAGLQVGSYGSYYRLTQDDPHPFARYLEAAVELGAPCIRVWAGHKDSGACSAAEWQALLDDARRIATAAAEHGIRIAFEYHSHSATDTVAGAKRLMEEADHPNLSIYWQQRVGQDDESNLDELEAILPWCHHLHCFYWTDPPRTQHPLQEGKALWSRVFARVDEALDDDRLALIEFVKDGDPQQFRQDAATLREWLAPYDEPAANG